MNFEDYEEYVDEDEEVFEDMDEDEYYEMQAQIAVQAMDEKLHRDADKKYPELEDRYCWKCGERLVKGSMAYYEGYHFDSCY